MTNFFSKKITVSLLAMMLSVSISHASLEKTSSNNPAPATVVALPDLPLSYQAKAFVKKYPNTAKASQQNLYITNMGIPIATLAMYFAREKGDITYPEAKRHQIEQCHETIYTAKYLADIYHNYQKKFTPVELHQFETFFASPKGKKLLGASWQIGVRTMQMASQDLNTIDTGENDYLTEEDKDAPAIEAFISSPLYERFLEASAVQSMKQPAERTAECIINVLDKKP